MTKRYLHMLRLVMIRSTMKRAEYMRKHRIFHSMGNRVVIVSRKIPLYSKLVSLGSNVWIASGVRFITHDGIHFMLNGMKDGNKYVEKIGCIEIGDNVFIGADANILYNVKVGNNVIIAAGALVNRDVPSNCVVGGIPARVIMSFDDYVLKRRDFKVEHPANNSRQEISEECEKELWLKFQSQHRDIGGKEKLS